MKGGRLQEPVCKCRCEGLALVSSREMRQYRTDSRSRTKGESRRRTKVVTDTRFRGRSATIPYTTLALKTGEMTTQSSLRGETNAVLI